MFIDQLRAAVEAADTPWQIADVERRIWQGAWSNGHLTDDEAAGLTELLHERKRLRAVRTTIKVAEPRIGKIRGPKKVAAIARRRYLASCWPLPPEEAQHFSLCEQSALRIIADEIKTRGTSTLCNAAIAARGGTSVSIVKSAVRKACARRLLMREERRRRGQASLTNIIRPCCPRYRKWICKHAAGCRPPGVRKIRNLPTTDNGFRKDGEYVAVERPQSGLAMTQIASSVPRGGP
jgi:hypothetical protein